jgi:hypothetical protein
MNIKRGLIAALICAITGAASAVLFIAVFLVGNWVLYDTHAVKRKFDIRWMATAWTVPAIGVAIYLGLTAFATYTPNMNYGFARTFAIIFLLSIPMAAFLGSLELTPKRVKSLEHPILYPSELSLLAFPPMTVAILLLATRINLGSNLRSTKESTEPSDASKSSAIPRRWTSDADEP